MARDIPPIHPGEILKEEFLDPLGISAYRLAKATRVPQDRVSNILHGRRGVTADTGQCVSQIVHLTQWSSVARVSSSRACVRSSIVMRAPPGRWRGPGRRPPP